MPMVAPVFEKKTGIRFSRIGLKGSGAGIKTLSEDGADICGVSRSLTSDERDLKYYYLIAGYDAIVIFVNKSNRVTALSAAAVKGIFTGKIRNWKEVGGADAPIVVVTEVKGGKRATLDEFRILAMDGADYGPSMEIDKPADCVKYVGANPNTVTFAGLAFRIDGVAIIQYDRIEPSVSNVSSGAYPLSRPMIFMTKKYPRGEIKKFFDFILSAEGMKILGEKIVPVRKPE